MNDMFGAPRSLRRLVWAVIVSLLPLLVARCGWENAAQLQQYTHHHHSHARVVPQ